MVDYILIVEIAGLIAFGSAIMALGVLIGHNLSGYEKNYPVDVPVQQTTHDEEYEKE